MAVGKRKAVRRNRARYSATVSTWGGGAPSPPSWPGSGPGGRSPTGSSQASTWGRRLPRCPIPP
eukprot:9748800-Alexandrium_andersonii.AAC.1